MLSVTVPRQIIHESPACSCVARDINKPLYSLSLFANCYRGRGVHLSFVHDLHKLAGKTHVVAAQSSSQISKHCCFPTNYSRHEIMPHPIPSHPILSLCSRSISFQKTIICISYYFQRSHFTVLSHHFPVNPKPNQVQVYNQQTNFHLFSSVYWRPSHKSYFILKNK